MKAIQTGLVILNEEHAAWGSSLERIQCRNTLTAQKMSNKKFGELWVTFLLLLNLTAYKYSTIMPVENRATGEVHSFVIFRSSTICRGLSSYVRTSLSMLRSSVSLLR